MDVHSASGLYCGFGRLIPNLLILMPDSVASRLVILLVDDDPSSIQFLADALKNDYQLKIARSGERALEIIAENALPDLILLDVLMPGIGGYETCRQLKRNKRTQNIPVIFITGKNSTEDEELGFSLGAVDYITKPYSTKILTRRIKTHIELKQHRDQLEQLVAQRTKALNNSLKNLARRNKVKQDFLNTISHELRTPINGIQGCLQLLEYSRDNFFENIEAAQQSTADLLLIVENILVFSELQSEALCLNRGRFNLATLVNELAREYAKRAMVKGLQFYYQHNPDTEVQVTGDQYHIRLAIAALLNNACKFTSIGNIDFDVSRVRTADNETIFRFEVADTGIGISPIHQKRIFRTLNEIEEDQLAEGSTHMPSQGMGIGLAVASTLTELMGGTIDVTSQFGQGSRFSIELPLSLAAVSKQVTDVSELNKAQGQRILIVEDNPVNQMIAGRFLEKLGYQVATAGNGQEAIEILKNKPFSAVLMDCQMPVMDGFQATKKIRQLNSAMNIPIIALTANAMSDGKQQCLAAGMNDYIAKPVKPGELEYCLQKWLG